MWFLFFLLVIFAVGFAATALISDHTGGTSDFFDRD